MTTTTCWREHKNSFLGAVLGSELSVTLVVALALRCRPAPILCVPVPGPLHRGSDGRPRPVLWTPNTPGWKAS